MAKIIPFPNNNTPKKDGEYFLKAVQAFWSQKERGLTAFPTNYVSKLEENRLYMRGLQPSSKYKDYYTSDEGQAEIERVQSVFIDQGATKEHVREGFANMDFSNIPTIAPKISLALHGQFDDVDWVTSAISTDARSGKEREKLKWRGWLFKQHREWLEKVSAMGGVELEQPDFIPDSIAELHLRESAGGYKIPWESAIEKAMIHSFEISNWDEIKTECLDDIIADNRLAVKIRTCEKSGKRIAEYVDLANFAIQYSKHYDHRDSEMAGTWEEVTVGELARHFDRKDLEKMAKHYSGKYQNPEDFDNYRDKDEMGMFKYDFFKVPVFYFSFIDYDNDYKASYQTPYGRRIERPVRHDYETKRGETKITTSIRKLKKVSWVIGTDFVYDYGDDNDMVRPDEKDVMIPYICISLPGKSITESAKVYYDDLVHIHLKTMNALITASSAGFALDIGALEGVTLNGAKVSEMTLFDLYKHKGILLFKRKDNFLQQTTGSGTPIFELPGGIGRFLQEQITLFEHTMSMLENITGINPVTLGSQPEERAAVRNVQASVRGTENILRPIVRALRNLKRRMGENFALSIPYLIRHYPKSREAYEEVIGNVSAEILSSIKDDIYKMGIKLEPMLTHTHQEALLRMVDLSLQANHQGQAGISIADAMLVQERIILGSPLKQVRIEIAHLIRKAEERIRKEREEGQRIQGEEMRALEEQKHQQMLQEKDIDLTGAMDLDTHSMRNRVREEQAKSNLAILEKVMEEAAAAEEELAQ